MDNILLGKYQPVGNAVYGSEEVELIKNTATGRILALKTISQSDTHKYIWTTNKKENLIKLSQNSIIRVTDFLADDEKIYFVKDYIEGDSIAKRIENGEVFKWRACFDWFVQLCDAMITMHRSKGEMKMVAFNTDDLVVGQGDIIKALNIGYAPDYKGQGIDSAFVAPEVYETGEVSNASDIYSLGVCLYHMLTGEKPVGRDFVFGKIREINPKVPEGFEYIINKCLEKDVNKRYNSAAAILRDVSNMDKLGESYIKGQKSLAIKTCIIIGAVVVCSLIVSLVYSGAEKRKMSKYIELVSKGYAVMEQSQDYEAADKIFKEAISLHDGVHAHIGVARILLAQGEYKKCEAYLNGINQSHGANASGEYNYIRGMLLYNNKEFSEAVLYLARAHELETENIEYKTQLGICYTKANNYIKAEQIRKELVSEVGESDWHAVVLDSYIKVLEKDTETAEKQLLGIADQIDEISVVQQIYIEVASFYEKSMEGSEGAEKCAEILESFFEKYPDCINPELLIAMGDAYVKVGKYAESISYYKYANDTGASDYTTYVLTARACVKAGIYDEAEENLNEVLVRFPDYKYIAYVELSYMEIEKQANLPSDQRDYSTMIGYYNNATKSAPNGARTAEVVPLANKLRQMTTQGVIQP